MGAWEEDQEDEDYSTGFSWLKAIPLIFIIGLVLFATGKVGTTIMDNAHIWSIGIALISLIALWSDSTLHAGSPQFIGNPIHTSINPGSIRTVGNYTIVRLGGFYKYGMHSQGSEGTAIMPNSAVNIRGRSIDGAVQFVPTPFEDLSPEVKETIDKFKYPKPFWFGLTDTVEFVNVPDLTFLESEIKLLNRQYSRMEEQLKDKYENIERAIEHSKRLSDTMNGGFFRSRFRKPKDDDD